MKDSTHPPITYPPPPPPRHVPYYAERKLKEEEIHIEELKDDKYQGLGVPSRSLYMEIFDAGTADAYAEITIFDGTHESGIVLLKKGYSITYEYWDAIYAEWVKLKAKGSWIKYLVHAVPGVWE